MASDRLIEATAAPTAASGKLLYGATVILGGCLLFLVQPLIAKIILPWFGGSSAVWSAALVFFQICVLGGYTYAHWLTSSLQPRLQGIVHTALLLAGCALMPILPSDTWRPVATTDPTLQILLLLAATVGLPSLLLSATSPLLQAWYVRRTGSQMPYWLFALSNVGSLLALLSFPFVLEPAFSVRSLAMGWSGAFVVFAALSACAAWMSSSGEVRAQAETAEQAGAPPSIRQMALWLLLSACACALLVSISTHLSTNVAPIPLLWVAPLALYLLTFILAFGSRRFYDRARLFPWVAAAIGGIAYLYTHGDSNLHIRWAIPVYLAGLFICCLACHGELAYRRPSTRYLTRFYLIISLGGALGGVSVAVIAPYLFDTYLELPLLLIALALLSGVVQWRRRGSARTLWAVRVALVVGIVALTGVLARAETAARSENLLVRRNFYGVLRVRDDTAETRLASRHLVHGTISHGSQFLGNADRYLPGSYFSSLSAVGRTLEALERRGPIHYGVIGLGAGVLSSYARQGDQLTVYEINPAVVDIANEYFTFLSHARASGADVRVLLGDARLTLERQPAQQFDLLIVDAFSSDAIPMHLLTNEAIELYFRHLKQDGVLAVHISNRYLDLEPVCLRAAQHVGRTATVLANSSDSMFSASVWVLITSDDALLLDPAFAGAHMKAAGARADFQGWTDEYSSIWPVLKWE